MAKKPIDRNSEKRTAIVTRSVFSGQRRLRHVFREKAYGINDTGWRCVGDGDTQGYINHERNVLVIDIKTLCRMEPMLADILDEPAGTELELIEDSAGKRFVNADERKSA